MPKYKILDSAWNVLAVNTLFGEILEGSDLGCVQYAALMIFDRIFLAEDNKLVLLSFGEVQKGQLKFGEIERFANAHRVVETRVVKKSNKLLTCLIKNPLFSSDADYMRDTCLEEHITKYLGMAAGHKHKL